MACRTKVGNGAITGTAKWGPVIEIARTPLNQYIGLMTKSRAEVARKERTHIGIVADLENKVQGRLFHPTISGAEEVSGKAPVSTTLVQVNMNLQVEVYK
jgi:hypothetical protein